MSDDEEVYSEEEEEEEEVIETEQPSGDPEFIKKQDQKRSDLDEQLREYIQEWRKQRAKEEDELKRLKEKQAKRKVTRAEEEKKLAERKKQEEERRQREIEEKKQKDIEEKRLRLEEAEKKRQAMLQAMNAANKKGPNFTVTKKDPNAANLSPAQIERNKTKEQLEEEKKISLSIRIKPLSIDGLGVEKLREKAAELWQAIVKLETEKYDLEERQKRQDYDLKELKERQKQQLRHKALKKGLDPEALTGKYPPKIQVASKYERRVDTRSYGDKKKLFEGFFNYEFYITPFLVPQQQDCPNGSVSVQAKRPATPNLLRVKRRNRLKEKQAKRKIARADEEKATAERKKQEEERRVKEIEEKKIKDAEDKKQRLIDAEKKRQAMMAALKEQHKNKTTNFVIRKKALAASLTDAEMERTKTKEQLEEEKKIALSIRIKPLALDGLAIDKLKEKATELWDIIVKLETEKYDLEERMKRQEYDLKELKERQRQQLRHRALKKGLDPEALTGPHPPKIQLASKYERRVDIRSFDERQRLFQGLEKTWKERMQEFMTRPRRRLPRWCGERPGKKPGDPETPEGEEETAKGDEIEVEDTVAVQPKEEIEEEDLEEEEVEVDEEEDDDDDDEDEE
ncbi:hypothetical protein D910_07407 [Dendroctonus ponderosae]|uniref:Troponin T n=1 Tax=Dendroctonus ponderosae TaxID=77166 RepID=U4UJ99_DENPD|nr:hypothetical protein D910_07407 [Dendroctonus ponderosae]